MVQVGTPAIDVTFSSIVSLAMRSILASQSDIRAVSRDGVRINWAQMGRLCMIRADTSPARAVPLGCRGFFSSVPPIDRLLPVKSLESGKLLTYRDIMSLPPL